MNDRTDQKIFDAMKTATRPRPVCAWCPGFKPPTTPGVSHGICPTCAAKFEEGERS